MTNIQRVAVVGAGSMGTLLGARLIQSGLAVQMVDANPLIVEAINRNGLTVKGTVSIQVPAAACLPEHLEGVYDLVIFLTKQTQNQAVFPQIGPHISQNGAVLTLQNGLPEQSAASYFGEARVLGCTVTWAATLEGPGVTRATTNPGDWHNNMGRPDGTVTDQVLAVRDVLSRMCQTRVETNLLGVRWSKLLVNSALSGMSAVLGCTFGQVPETPGGLRCAQYIARECILTARACGVRMEPLAEGEDFDQQLFFEGEADRERTADLLRKLFCASAQGRASMLQDLERGVPTEVDYINGAVCRMAAAAGVKTPCCAKVVELVHLMETGVRTPGRHNLAFFEGSRGEKWND